MAHGARRVTIKDVRTMPPALKEVTVVIPTLNEEENIAECIGSLKRQTYPIKEFIVVDSGSDDRTVEIAKEQGATVLQGKRNHYYNSEVGIGAATTPVVLCTDGDCQFPKWWLKTAMSYLENPDVWGVMGDITPLNDNPLSRAKCDLRNEGLNLAKFCRERISFNDRLNRGNNILFLRDKVGPPWFLREPITGSTSLLPVKARLVAAGMDDGCSILYEKLADHLVYDPNLYIRLDIPPHQQANLVAWVLTFPPAGLFLAARPLLGRERRPWA